MGLILGKVVSNEIVGARKTITNRQILTLTFRKEETIYHKQLQVHFTVFSAVQWCFSSQCLIGVFFSWLSSK